MSGRYSFALFCAACVLALSTGAMAEPVPDTLAEAAAPMPAEPLGPFGAAKAVEGSALQAASGMANLQQIANANNSSVVAGNSVNGQSVTGQIAIDGQSFQNMNGLSILTANTGNNVSINAAMNVNVSIQQ